MCFFSERYGPFMKPTHSSSQCEQGGFFPSANKGAREESEADH